MYKLSDPKKQIKLKGTKDKDNKTQEEQLKEWQDVEKLVFLYQSQFEDKSKSEEAKVAMLSLLERFFPLFKKYTILIKSGQINFNDPEMRRFVLNFMKEPELKWALKKRWVPNNKRSLIYQRFNFVRETYGNLTENEIMEDLKMLFMEMVRRYKTIGKSFCAYCYYCFCYDVARHIRAFTKDPANIHYRSAAYEDYLQTSIDEFKIEDKPFEENLFESAEGVPDLSWVEGITCSEIFAELTPLERRLLIKYYLEDYNDKQIAEGYGMNLTVVNAKRRAATEALAEKLGIDKTKIKRGRKSTKDVPPLSFLY